uniref:DNA-directed DNA polymerase n=1 Tax=Plutella xylostella granulovirus TaxID=98383 RepID=A0A142DWT6_9BBAC|nr:PxGV-Torf91 protein [Plutella xylostella granulovirus]
MMIDGQSVLRITRLKYENRYLYIFLTGTDCQFYFKTACTLYSYKLCYTDHRFRSCRSGCETHKTMVVTGYKERECDRIHVIKMERSKCADEKFLLDDFCNDVNRVQMQLNIHEGDYVRFEKGVEVNEHGCASGTLSDMSLVPVESLTQPIELVVACFDLETYTNGLRFTDPAIDPIISISLVVRGPQGTKKMCIVNTNRRNVNFDDVGEEVSVFAMLDERSAIEKFYELLWRSNPDEVLDYNGDSFDIPFLMRRAEILGVGEDVLRRYDLPPTKIKWTNIRSKYGYDTRAHSLDYYNHTDILQYVKGSMDHSKIENLKLETVAKYYLGVGKLDMNVREMIKLYERGEMAKIVEYNVRDSVLPVNIFLKCQVANKLYADAALMNLCRDDYMKTISHKINLALFDRALKNTLNDSADSYFFNKFDLNKMCKKIDDGNDEVDLTKLARCRVPEHHIPKDAVKLCPLKCAINYTGGKVLAPKPGYYELLFTLDFSQLYTSIMIAETACLSNLFFGTDGYLYLQKNDNAITTKFLREMATKRAEWKADMKKNANNPFMYSLYDSWQNAAKLICNSQYGWFGMYCKALANHITAIGRQRLDEAKRKIESLSDSEPVMRKWGLKTFKLEVVYGDTDSNFVSITLSGAQLNMDELRKLILDDILSPVNACWNGAYRMELENIIKNMLIKGKKSYVCLKENNALYKRGFNVKKDVPIFLRHIFDETIHRILLHHSLDCVLKYMVGAMKERRDAFSVDNKEEYCFSQTLNKTSSATIAFKLYMKLKECPHVKEVPNFGERIQYLLEDKSQADKVGDRVIPLDLVSERTNINWSKHLSIVCTFFNDLMSMMRNDDLFQLAFDEICDYYQKDQLYDRVYYTMKRLTPAKMKDLVAKEMNVKDKKTISEQEFRTILEEGRHNVVHECVFMASKRPPATKVDVRYGDSCPVLSAWTRPNDEQCNGLGVAAVFKTMKRASVVVNNNNKKRKLM